ncbi:hypothetical protein [Streptomyces aureocirculatus]|uniref:hypothetical protein n=1 Tax=Streptomyces aureocirculatus TaxID=67275 RepID=UPI0004C5A15D|nr:hypothetical protein [Streptomyces aureocirculatus]
MNTTAAAIRARDTVATVRTWCGIGAVAAVKRAGRWIIDTASLAARIAIGRMRTRKATAMGFAPLSRTEFEQAAAALGIRTTQGHPLPRRVRRLHGHRRPLQRHAELVAPSAGAQPSPPKASLGPARRSYPHECDICGLDARTCDCR